MQSFKQKLESESKAVSQPDYSEEEILYRGNLITLMERARDQRDSNHDEFDGMTYLEWYETNAKSANSYIPPRQNKGDTRVVSGVTHEKENTLLSSLLNFNFEPNVMAFDEQNYEIHELGENFEALIKKSRQIEHPYYDKKRSLIYKELLDQGTVFVEDILVEYQEIEKSLDNVGWSDGVQIKKNWKEKLGKVQREIQCNMISGPNMYLGDIKQFFIEKQPYIFTRQVTNYEEAETIFRNWERWKNVPRLLSNFNNQFYDIKYHNWTLGQVKKNQVEILKFQNKWTNEFMILVNGVMMLPVGFPLSALSGRLKYTIVKGDSEPINYFFAYSKSIPSKTKIDQSLLDEMYKAVILKTRKSYTPSYVNNSGRSLTQKIFLPGNITSDIDPNSIAPIGDNSGVTQSEFNVIEFLKRTIDEKSVSSVFQGQATGGNQTATEIMELKKQSMMKLGLIIFSVLNFEKDLAYLRLYNILKYWTQAQDQRVNDITGKLEDIYHSFSIEDSFEDGLDGTRIIEFSPNPPSSSQIMAEENILSKKRKVRKFYISPELLTKVNVTWYIAIEPTEKNVDALERAQFSKTIVEGFQLFGPQSFSIDYIKSQWAQKNKLDKDQLFPKQQPMNPMMGRAIPQEGGNINNQILKTIPRPAAPSVNTLVRNP